MDYQSQENEENYVSVRDFTEINSTSQSVNKSQLENLLFKTERHKQCGLQPLNSTILPKINLCEKQQENASKESIIRQPNRNLSKQIRKTSYVQIRPTKTSIGANLEPKEREGSIQDSFLCNQNTINKAINQRRRSSRMQVEQFQNTLLKMIQDKTSNQQEQKQKMLDIPDQNETLQTQEQEKSQIQNQVGEEQSCKLDTIQKLKKKDDKLKNSFVSRLGCIFHQVAKNVDESWITKNNLKTANWYEQYINSVYFSFITMVTVGYGDITPVSLQEKVFVIFMVVYSCGFFGYIVSSIGNIFTQRAQIQANYKRQLVDMIQYMKTRNISQVIQQQVFQYLHYLEQMDYYNHQKGEEIVKKLSPYLQQQININSYYPFLKSSNYFKLNFKDTILINASLKMKELTFGPGQIIFKQNDQDNRLFYILKGEVQLSSNNHQICIKDENDNCFGINEFFTGECRNLEAKSLTVSQILYLELNEFKQVLKEDPLEYEKFCSLKDQVIFSKISIDQPCFFCNKFSHRYDQCPFYTLKNQRLLVIEKSNRSISQERKQFERYDRFKFNSVLENAEVKLNLRAIRLNYINNLAIDKNEMIQLAQDTIQIENDVDFYRYNDAFQLKQNSEGQDFNIILVSSDKIADEFFLEEEKLEYGEEGNDQLNPIINSQKKVATSQTIATESLIEENKNQLQPALQNSQNQHRKSISFLQNAFHTQNSSNLNTYNYEKLQTIKEQFSTTNHRIQNHTRQQSSRKNSDISISSYQNKNAEPSPSKVQEQNLLKQILNLIELTQIKQEVENKHEVSFFIQKDEFFCINDFDQLQEFTRYFPKSNFSQVLGQISKTNLKKQKVPLKKAKKNQNKPRNTVFKNLAIKKKNILSKINTCRALANKHKKSQDTPLVIAKSSSYNQSNTESLSNALSCRTQEMQDFNIDQKSENKLLQSQQFDNVRSNFLKPQQ